jgi:excisionase family DNA binding protein
MAMSADKENNMEFNETPLPQIMTANEVAKVLKISRAFAYQLMRTQQIRSIKMGRSIRVVKDDLDDFIKMSAPVKDPAA